MNCNVRKHTLCHIFPAKPQISPNIHDLLSLISEPSMDRKIFMKETDLTVRAQANMILH